MKVTGTSFICAILVCGLASASLGVRNAHAQQANIRSATFSVENSPVATTNSSKTVKHDQVRTSAEHIYNSPAERAQDDLLITEVKSALAERGISDQYPVEVDCYHGKVQLSGVVASADDARQAETVVSNIKGVVVAKNQLTWR